jgi:hypothetical protein
VTYAERRLRELVKGSHNIDVNEDGIIHGTAINDYDNGESWTHWQLYQNLSNEEALDLIDELEESDTGWYRGPGRAFAHSAVPWHLPSGAVLVTQCGGVDV